MSGRSVHAVATRVFIAATLVCALAGNTWATACPQATVDWANRCNHDQLQVTTVNCPDDHTIVAVTLDHGTLLQVDITRNSGFRKVDSVFLSPIGNFGDWGNAPPGVRAAFTALETCALTFPEKAAPDKLETGAHASAAVGAGLPWRFLVGLMLLAGLVMMQAKRVTVRRATWVGGQMAGLIAGGWLVQWLCTDAAYFHQNGQGPMWLSFALDRPSAYGPGFAEMFSWILAERRDPDAALFVSQSLLCALAPACLWLVARRAGARPALCWVLALALVMDPIWARLAWSESYYATCPALLWMAVTTLALVAEQTDWRRIEFGVGVVGAGLLIAQAARIHPTAWVTAALVPLVLLCAPGCPKLRLRQTVVATLGIGVVVAVCAGPSMWRLGTGALAGHWAQNPAWEWIGHSLFDTLPLWIALVGGAIWQRRNRSLVVALGLFALVLAVVIAVHPHAEDATFFRFGYYRLGFVILLAPMVALLARALPKHQRAVTAAVAALAICWTASTLSWARLLPTDALEANLVRTLRSRVAPGKKLAYLHRVHDQVLYLPWRTQTAASSLDTREMATPKSKRDARDLSVGDYYYRSSLCAVATAQSFCQRVEATMTLETIVERTLPARVSLPGTSYTTQTVVVTLFRVTGRR